MSRVYPPYSKWLGSAFAALPCAGTLTPVLAGAMAAGAWRERERQLSAAYQATAERHNDLALTATISDQDLARLPPVGAIDQYVDSTELTAHEHADLRRRYLAGPVDRV